MNEVDMIHDSAHLQSIKKESNSFPSYFLIEDFDRQFLVYSNRIISHSISIGIQRL